MEEYRTIEEFKKRFLPKSYREELMKSMSPEELGRFLADESLEKVKSSIKRRR